MEIITIVGKSMSGKSSSIRYAIMELIDIYGFDVKYNSKKYSNDKETLLHKMDEDFCTSKGYVGQITCAGSLNGKNLCITTYGDSIKYDILPSLEKGRMEMGRIDIFVCCTHDKVLEEVRNIFNNEPYVMNKNQDKSQSKDDLSKINKQFSKEIVKCIMEHVGR